MYAREILVEPTGANVARKGGDWNTNLHMPYRPPPLSAEEAQAIDAKYELDVENAEREKQGLTPLEELPQ